MLIGFRSLKWIICSLLFLGLAGCQSSILKKLPTSNIEEQLYVDAELSFTIKHPLTWKRQSISVSSPQYRADTVHWRISDLNTEGSSAGTMVIQSTPSETTDLHDLLNNFLTEQPEFQKKQEAEFPHTSGPALRLLGQNKNYEHLTIAIQGRQHNFIISLKAPKEHWNELLPIFDEIVNSFSEIVRPQNINEKSSS